MKLRLRKIRKYTDISPPASIDILLNMDAIAYVEPITGTDFSEVHFGSNDVVVAYTEELLAMIGAA